MPHLDDLLHIGLMRVRNLVVGRLTHFLTHWHNAWSIMRVARISQSEIKRLLLWRLVEILPEEVVLLLIANRTGDLPRVVPLGCLLYFTSSTSSSAFQLNLEVRLYNVLNWW